MAVVDAEVTPNTATPTTEMSVEPAAEQQPTPPTLPAEPATLPAEPAKTLEEKPHKASTKRASGTRSPAQKLLGKVPTPSRSPRANEAIKMASSAVGGADRFGASALGPEPWGADAEKPAVPAAKGGYREWLQARGQQAMQRSLMQGGGRHQGMPASPVPPAACPGPLLTTSAGTAPQVHLQRWFGPGGLDYSATGGSQPAVAFSACGRPPLLLPGIAPAGQLAYSAPATPLSAQPSPLASPLAFGTLSQMSPVGDGSTTASLGTQPPTPTSAGSWQEGSANATQQKECNQEELMTMLMPGGLGGLDSHQLAEQLRAVAPCSYED